MSDFPTYDPPPFPPAPVEDTWPEPKQPPRWLRRTGLVLLGVAVIAVPLGITLRSTMDERDTLTEDLADTEDDLANTEDDLDASEEENENLTASLESAHNATRSAEIARDNALDDYANVSTAIDSCRDAAITLEDALNARITQNNFMFDALQSAARLQAGSMSAALDQATAADAEADRLYDDAVVQFTACLSV